MVSVAWSFQAGQPAAPYTADAVVLTPVCCHFPPHPQSTGMRNRGWRLVWHAKPVVKLEYWGASNMPCETGPLEARTSSGWLSTSSGPQSTKAKTAAVRHPGTDLSPRARPVRWAHAHEPTAKGSNANHIACSSGTRKLSVTSSATEIARPSARDGQPRVGQVLAPDERRRARSDPEEQEYETLDDEVSKHG